jgi:hypothetical protein
MLPRMRHGVRRLRSGALTLALAAFVPLAIPAAASANVGPGFAPSFAEPANQVIYTGPGPIVNQANAASALDLDDVFKVKTQLAVSLSPVVNAFNHSVALTSECSNCYAISIAFQIVTTTEQDLVSLDAINVASATNYQCTGICDADAEAYQLVVATDTPQAMPFAALLSPVQIFELYQVQTMFNDLPRDGLSPSQIGTTSTYLVNQAMNILLNATYQASAPMYSPAVHGAETNAALTQSDRPVVKLYHDVQSSPGS